MVILEIEKIIWVETKLGKGIALFLIDYGVQNNTIWIVALEDDGKIKHFDSNQIRLVENFTLNIKSKKNK